MLEAALSRAGRDDEQQRLGVYKAAIAAVDKLPEETRPRYREQLNRAIIELEQEFGTFEAGKAGKAANTPQVQTPDDSNAESHRSPAMSRHDDVSGPEIFPDRDLEQASGYLEPGHMDNFDTGMAFETEASTGAVAPSSGRMKWLLLAALAIVLLLLAGWLVWNSVLGTTAKDAAPTSPAPAQAESSDTLVLVNDRFPGDLSNWRPAWQSAAANQDSALAYADYFDNGELIVKDGLNLYNSSFLPVDTDSVYVMKVTLELVEEGELPRLNAGVATFDKDGKLLTSPPGTHRYFLSTGKLQKPAGITPGESFEISGIIAETGDESHSRFRDGTDTVKLVMLFSAPENAAKLAIREVSFVQVSD